MNALSWKEFEDAECWNEEDWKNMEGLAFHLYNLNPRKKYDARCVGEFIVGDTLEAFQEKGMYSEGQIPYFSARELLLGGLAACDPLGGSFSARQFYQAFNGGSDSAGSAYDSAGNSED